MASCCYDTGLHGEYSGLPVIQSQHKHCTTLHKCSAVLELSSVIPDLCLGLLSTVSRAEVAADRFQEAVQLGDTQQFLTLNTFLLNN